MAGWAEWGGTGRSALSTAPWLALTHRGVGCTRADSRRATRRNKESATSSGAEDYKYNIN